MNPLFKKLHTAAQDIRLSDAERDAMRDALMLHMRANPLARVPAPVKSPYASFFDMRRVMPFVALLLVVILGAGGTAYAAQGALPGDMLYPVKISVNEQVETALATTPAEKAQVHVTLAQRRLEEAQALAQQGRLNASTTQELQSNLSEHAQAAQAIAQTVAQAYPDQAAELSAQLTSSLAVGSAVLVNLGEKSKDKNTRKDIASIAATAREHAANVLALIAGKGKGEGEEGVRTMFGSSTASSTTATTTEASTTSTTTREQVSQKNALRLGKRAADELSSALELFKGSKDSLDASTTAQAQAEFSAVQELLDSGNAKLGAGDTSGAFSDFSQAYAGALQLETIIKAANRWGGGMLKELLDLQASVGASILGGEGASTSASSSLQDTIKGDEAHIPAGRHHRGRSED